MPPKKNPNKKNPPSKASVSAKEQAEDKNSEHIEDFILEVAWCLRQLELSVENKPRGSKQAEDLMKSHRILRSNKTPLIKKRQLMNSLFGDYRAKIAEEYRRFKPAHPRLTSSSTGCPKSVFMKKSHSCQRKQDSHKMTDSSILEEQLTGDSAAASSAASDITSSNLSHMCVKKLELTNTVENNFKFNFVVT